MNRRTSRTVTTLALVAGVALLVLTFQQADSRSFSAVVQSLGPLLLLTLVPSAVWHLLRTEAWRLCFPRHERPSFWRAFRVRFAAEAFSFVTVRGVAGEPLKVMLLKDEVRPETAAAAVAAERLAYILVTTVVLGVASVAAILFLPLNPVWNTIFAASAVCSGAVVGLLIALALRVRSTPPSSWRRERGAVRRWRERVAQGLHRVRNRLRALLREPPDRIVELLLLEACAYLMMALEVFAVLRLVNVPAGIGQAAAIETFTRAASFVSAVIPGNLGALEASNVAAARAVHVAAHGALALAIVRRIRGLVWCAAGFLVYPWRRVRKPAADDPYAATSGSGSSETPMQQSGGTLVVLELGRPDVTLSDRLGGLPIGERVMRAARRAGYARVIVWTPSQGLEWQELQGRFAGDLEVLATGDPAPWRSYLTRLPRDSAVTVLAPGTVPSWQVLEGARGFARPADSALEEMPSGRDWPRSGVFVSSAEHLRRPELLALELFQSPHGKEPPLEFFAPGVPLPSLRAWDEKSLAVAERQLRRSVFKTTDGRLGRFNRRMSLPISLALIRGARFSPHAMSVVVMALGFLAGWFFSRGSYAMGVLGATLSWAASVLDGCDGELARLQFKESAFGCWLDTLGDYTYYLAIFIGLTVGAARQTGWSGYWWIGGLLLMGTGVTLALLVLLRRRITGTQPELLRTNAKAHFYATGKTWARVVAKLSTCATRATAPYGILVLSVFGLVPVVLILATVGAHVYWISLAVELRRLLGRSLAAVPTPSGDMPLGAGTFKALSTARAVQFER